LDPADRKRELVPRLEHSMLHRVNGVLLSRGFKSTPGKPQCRQTWLCTVDYEAGLEAVQKLPARASAIVADGVAPIQPHESLQSKY
jgi:hypothetical protein